MSPAMPAPTTHTSTVMSLVSAGRDCISAVAIQTEVVISESLFMLCSPFVIDLEMPDAQTTYGFNWFRTLALGIFAPLKRKRPKGKPLLKILHLSTALYLTTVKKVRLEYCYEW